MRKISYNPFDKELENINEADLQKLIDNKICEGWYIEYKSRVPILNSNLDNNKIAKSISSFANTKGGWIFWGISCVNKENDPFELTGIDITSFKNFQDTISQIIASNINPQPIFHFKEITLSNGLIVFTILVEESPIPPYITSQGVIYQRENNESKPIKDRYILEKLNEKANNYYESIERFSQFDLGQTKGQSESNQSFLELYLYPKPFESFEFKKFYETDFFKDIANIFYDNVEVVFDSNNNKEDVLKVPLNLGFNSVYQSFNSIIIRPLSEINLIYKTTTVELFKNGNLKFLMPLYSFDSTDIPDIYSKSSVIEYILDKFSPNEIMEESHISNIYDLQIETSQETVRKDTDFVKHVQFIDGFNIIITILIVIEKYKNLLTKNDFNLSTELGFRAKVTNAWRKFVFFDSEDYLEKIKLYNIPLTPKNEIEIPEFKKGKSFSISLDKPLIFLTIAHIILEGIGLPDSSTINFQDIINRGLNRLINTN